MTKEHDHPWVVEFLRQIGHMVGELPTPYRFVLEHGWAYRPIPLPRKMTLGQPKQCFHNAIIGANGSLYYCEGYVVAKSGIPIHHAWLTDGKGNAIDVTLQEPGFIYVGVPFKTEYVVMEALRSGATISLFDNWEAGFPLLRAWKNPDEWLEAAGAGFEKLQT